MSPSGTSTCSWSRYVPAPSPPPPSSFLHPCLLHHTRPLILLARQLGFCVFICMHSLFDGWLDGWIWPSTPAASHCFLFSSVTQVSHHPPVSALYATDDENDIRLQWTRRVYPHFYGNERCPAALHASSATYLYSIYLWRCRRIHTHLHLPLPTQDLGCAYPRWIHSDPCQS